MGIANERELGYGRTSRVHTFNLCRREREYRHVLLLGERELVLCTSVARGARTCLTSRVYALTAAPGDKRGRKLTELACLLEILHTDDLDIILLHRLYINPPRPVITGADPSEALS